MEAHGGEEQPEFILRTVRFFRSALSRQVGEAVRIMRRGGAGAILNSKSEFDRCRIPRLVLDDKEDSEEEVRRKEEQRLIEDKEAVEEQAEIWSTARFNERRKDDLRAWAERTKTTGPRKTKKEVEDGSRRAKKMKYSIFGEDWGEEEQMTEESSTTINSEEMSRTPDKITPTPPPPPVRIVEIDHFADAISIKPSNRLQVLRNNETSSRNRSASPAKRPRVDDNHDNTEDAVATRPSYSSVVLNSPQPLLDHPPVAEARADGAEGRVRQVNISEYLTRS